MLDLIDPEHRALVASKLIGRDEMSRLAGAIAFYGGSFDPPHDGHEAVMEAALISVADKLVVSVHSHNLATKPGQHADLHHRVTMVALVLESSPFGEHMRIADPEELDGIQNLKFEQIASDLVARGSTPWIVMGQDAVKPTYRKEMRSLSHIVVERPPYADRTGEVLAGPVVRVGMKIDPLYRAAERKVVARLYDARIGGFHDAIAPDGDRSSYENRPLQLLFSDRIEGHPYMSFTIPSFAAFDRAPTRWARFKTPLRVTYWGSEHPGYFRLSR
jgi:cytidyltransferase-like protein